MEQRFIGEDIQAFDYYLMMHRKKFMYYICYLIKIKFH